MNRPRVMVLTDISSLTPGVGEPDDTQSLIRLLLYANEVELEGLIATYTCHGNDVKPEYIHAVLDAYDQVHANLLLHDPGYPSADALRKTVKRGSPRDGIECIGTTEGSEWIVQQALRDDPRPLWILVWGGCTDLAQALWSAEQRLAADRFADVLARLRVYAISDQYGGTGAWIRERYPELFFITNYSAFRGMYKEGDTSLVSSDWLKEHVIEGHGALGAAYPDYRGGDLWGRVSGIKEGDTPSFLYVLPGGPGNPEKPWVASWGGRFTAEASSPRHFSDGPADERRIAPETWETVYRWRNAFQASFQARMDRCVFPYDAVNHEPAAVIDGPSELTASAGDVITLDASQSYDPDGNALTFRWEIDSEASGEAAKDAVLTVDASRPSIAVIRVPKVASRAEVHVLLTVTDDGDPPLCAYRRTVITVLP